MNKYIDFNEIMDLRNLRGKLYLTQVDSEGHQSCMQVQLNRACLSIDRQSGKLTMTLGLSHKKYKVELTYFKGTDHCIIGDPKGYHIKQYLTHEPVEINEVEYIFIEFTYCNLYETPLRKEVIKIPKSDFKKVGNVFVAFDGIRYHFINPSLIHKRGNKLIKYKIIYG